MENYEIYNDLINGKLDDTTAKNLFSSLASDDMQRMEFNSYMSVSETIKTNFDSFQPSADLRNRIYSKAGVNSQLFDNQLPPAPKSAPGFWGSKLFTGIGSGLLSGIVVYLLMQYVGFPLYMKNFSNALATNNNAQNKIIPVIESKEFSTDSLIKQKPIIKYIYVYRDKENLNSTGNLDNNSQNFASINISKIDKKIAFSNIKHANQSMLNDNFGIKATNQNAVYDLSNITKNLGLSLEFGSSVNWNIPQETLSPAELNRFNNLEFTVFYNLNDFIKVGANIKQETFFTEYSGTEDIGSIYNYRQHPNLTTYSAVVRVNPFDYEIFNPYFQTSFGANESGIVLRPQIGLEIQPTNNMSFIFGIDYGYFRFIHQNSWFNAGKAGIDFGISYKF